MKEENKVGRNGARERGRKEGLGEKVKELGKEKNMTQGGRDKQGAWKRNKETEKRNKVFNVMLFCCSNR